MTFSQYLTCQLGKCSCGLIDAWVYLVSWQFFCIWFWQCFFTFLYIIIVHPCIIRYFFYLFLFTAFWIVSSPMFTICTLIVIFIVRSGLVWVWLWIFWIWSRMVLSGFVCVFPSLVVHVVFCCYRCWFDVLSVTCNYSPCSGDLYFVWPVVVIVIALSNYCPMDPQSPIFPLNCYSWPYVDRY